MDARPFAARRATYERFAAVVKLLRTHGADTDAIACVTTGLAYITAVMDWESEKLSRAVAKRVNALLPVVLLELDRIILGEDKED